MDKRIAIITIYGETNFGNRLQNYALSAFLNKLGNKCETIVFKKKTSFFRGFLEQIKKIACFLFFKNNERSRERRFRKFTKKYIKTKYVNPNRDLSKLSKQYDYFVVGSDQVWNPTFGNYEALFDTMFLRFAPESKRIAFSPSFGIKEIPEEWKGRFIEGLDGFKTLSSRERDGVSIIKKLTGKDAKCLADPTMLLSNDEWKMVSSKRLISEKYVLLYFLGKQHSIPPTNYRIVDILDKNSGNYYKYNPSDFISLIENAECVFTDSFHACVFSIIFGKDFVVYPRDDNNKNMLSRIVNLLSLFSINYNPDKPEIICIPNSDREKVINRIQREAFEYLKNQII